MFTKITMRDIIIRINAVIFNRMKVGEYDYSRI